jgi:hypothetical protein
VKKLNHYEYYRFYLYKIIFINFFYIVELLKSIAYLLDIGSPSEDIFINYPRWNVRLGNSTFQWGFFNLTNYEKRN